MSHTSTGFEAYAFNPDLGNEVATGRIFVDQWSFHFRSDAINLDIPLPRLEVQLGEDDDERVFFSYPNVPGWQVYTLDQTILRDQRLLRIDAIRNQLSNIVTRRELSSRLKVTLWCLAVCCLLAGLGWFATKIMVRSLVRNVPPETEQKFGDLMMEMVSEEMVFVEDTNRVARIAELAAPLMAVMPADSAKLKFYLVENPEPNAMALPGGHVIIHTGLLEMVDRPEELLGVIAHETAHVTEKHGIRGVISTAGPFLIFSVFLGGGNGILGLLTDGSELLVQQSFSQEFEKEADDVGWDYLVAASIDPRGLTEFLMRMKSYEVSLQLDDGVPEAFSSHPALEKRIARLEGKWKKLKKKSFKPLPPREFSVP